MWRKLLNSAVLAIITHRKPKRVFDGTSTQVKAQMINKCRIKMVQRELYNIRDLPWERGEKEKENIVAIKFVHALCLVDLFEKSPPRTMN